VIPIRKYDTEYWRSTSAGLQREVDHFRDKTTIQSNIIQTIARRIERICDEVSAGRMNESDALQRLNNLAQLVFRSVEQQENAVK
jgi:cob(I)alamin adenosyltransferase